MREEKEGMRALIRRTLTLEANVLESARNTPGKLISGDGCRSRLALLDVPIEWEF
jgi:hypothetical protein